MDSRITIHYYEGEEEERTPLPEAEFANVEAAICWCVNNNIPFSVVQAVEWDHDRIDAYGAPEIVGMCNLLTAVEENLAHFER